MVFNFEKISIIIEQDNRNLWVDANYQLIAEFQEQPSLPHCARSTPSLPGPPARLPTPYTRPSPHRGVDEDDPAGHQSRRRNRQV